MVHSIVERVCAVHLIKIKRPGESEGWSVVLLTGGAGHILDLLINKL